MWRLCARSAGTRLGWLPGLRLDLAAAGAAQARRCHRHRRAAGATVQRELPGRAHPHPDEEHLLRGRAGSAMCAGPGHSSAHCCRRPTQKAAAGRSQHEASSSVTTTRARTSPARCRCAREDGCHPGNIVIDATPRRTRLRLCRRHGGRVVSDTPSTSLMDAFQGLCDRLRVDEATGRKEYS